MVIGEQESFMSQQLQQINALIGEQRIAEAEKLCQKLTTTEPNNADGWIQFARICQMKGDSSAMLHHAQQALLASPHHAIALLQESEALLLSNNIEEALVKLTNLENTLSSDPKLLIHVADLYTHASHVEAAMRVYKHIHTIVGDDVELLYNMANAAIALGQADKAEQLLDRLIELNPHDYDAYYNRATYRKQTIENNHIDEMKFVLKSGLKSPQGEVQMGFALAKECEDVGEYEQSFHYLKIGADRRKSMLAYKVEDDVETMQEIQRLMQGNFFADMPETSSAAGPIFILGMPRSGTTLVDRILSSHSKVDSLGEINDFALEMLKHAPRAESKLDLIAKTCEIDFSKLQQAYEISTRSRNATTPYLIDKTPANFLYIGLIAKSIPNAKIIHLQRNPMDSCYAMYKTLFRMGYPFSYNLDDLSAYYIAYRKLMEHWRQQLPGRFLDLDYEALVADQEAQSRLLIDYVGLDWESACLNFHQNKTSSSTASAAQIRQPIYKSSIEKWRHYENELQPLTQALNTLNLNPEGNVNG